jgi:hypothetical protein
MLNQNIISNKFDLNWSTTFSYIHFLLSTLTYTYTKLNPSISYEENELL